MRCWWGREIFNIEENLLVHGDFYSIQDHQHDMEIISCGENETPDSDSLLSLDSEELPDLIPVDTNNFTSILHHGASSFIFGYVSCICIFLHYHAQEVIY